MELTHKGIDCKNDSFIIQDKFSWEEIDVSSIVKRRDVIFPKAVKDIEYKVMKVVHLDE